MNSPYDYIVTPVEQRYDNIKKIGNRSLILNSQIESFKSVSKLAKVVSIPLAYNLDVEIGDLVYIHHNVFRRFYNMKGKQQNSRSYFKEDLYFCSPDQIDLYKHDKEIKAFLDRCFIKPLLSNKLEKKLQENKGIVKYSNSILEKSGIKKGDIVSFPSLRNWEFIVENELLYCMKSKDILIKHECKGNEKEYNPSWAYSS